MEGNPGRVAPMVAGRVASLLRNASGDDGGNDDDGDVEDAGDAGDDLDTS